MLNSDGTPVTIVTSIISNFDSEDSYPDPEIPAQELAVTSLQDLSKIIPDHLFWWAAFWNVSSISLPSAPLLEVHNPSLSPKPYP